MKRRRTDRHSRRGLTLVEMSVAMAVSAVMFLAVMNVLASNHKNYNQTYDRVYGEVVTDAYVSRLAFDHVVRMASEAECDPCDVIGKSMKVYYRSEGVSILSAPDRYALFSQVAGSDGNDLILEQGKVSDGKVLSTQVLAHHVTSCTFQRSGPCIDMAMVLYDGHVRMPVLVTATRHNE